MATYIILSNLTDEGAKTLKNKPERIKEVNQEFSALGVKVLSQYALLGPYDLVNIVEGPDGLPMPPPRPVSLTYRQPARSITFTATGKLGPYLATPVMSDLKLPKPAKTGSNLIPSTTGYSLFPWAKKV